MIQESSSDWASSPVLIRKRDGTVRWCIDYRKLNNVTVKDVFPLPLVDDCLDTLAGSVWFSKLDANSAYWQINIRAEDRHKTAFHTRYGLYEHVKMGFGLTGAPATYARVMNLVMRGLNWKTLLAFLDDVLILGKTFEDHLTNLGEALKRFRKYGMKLKPSKSLFFQKEVEFLGRLVSGNKLAMTQTDIQAVAAWPIPTCSKDVERFMGLANYHRNFVKNFSELAEPLYRVVGKHKFRWKEEQMVAFDALKSALTNPPVLALPNQHDSFVLDTDASNEAIGAELIQIQDGQEKVIAYGSYALTKEQRRYCTTRKELLAIVRFCRQYRYYLLGKPFTIRTDHSSLRWLLRFKEPQGQLARWMEELSQYNMVLTHRAGVKHLNADALSRIADRNQVECDKFVPGVKPTELPCGGCQYCVRADSQWGTFTREVDDAVPLTLLDSSGVEGVARNARAPGTGGSDHGELGGPLVDDTALGGKGPGAQQTYRVISAETVGVGVNNQIRQCGKPVYCEGEARNVDGYALEQISTTDCDRVKTGSLLNDVGSAVQLTTKNSDESCVEILWANGGTVDVNVFKPVVTTYDVGAPKREPVLSCWGFDVKEVQKLQHEDQNLEFLLGWLETRDTPAEADLFIAAPVAKRYWLSKEEFLMIGGLLYHQRPDGSEKDLVMPQGLRQIAIELNHDLPSSGHQGEDRTKARLREKFFWFGLGKDVTHYVATCSTCNQNKKTTVYGRVPMQEYQAGAPMERVHLDFLGPLPKTPRGNEHVLMMVDQFTKWVECVPLPSQTAEVTAKAAVDSFFSRFGYPYQIFTDQGRNFESKLFIALCEALEIHKARTTPYRPSANGQVERYNRTLMDAVRCYINDSQDQWDLHLQQIAGALRSSVNRSTGFTANRLMLGREVNTPAYLMFPQPAVENQTPEQFVAKLTRNIEAAHNAARQTLKTSLKRMKRSYDLRGILRRPFNEREVVYLLDTAVLKGKCRKLCRPWKGPAVIVEKISSSLFRVQLRKSMFVVNHDRMKHCKDRA
ncbi:MAG: DDE-type integrase/transposase/recombinase, partial [Candidatus Thiodiazotropha taylori]|nr:DDE-type integrase/transposase/recombinase [Candidatus Thiodiazotropha taylori]